MVGDIAIGGEHFYFDSMQAGKVSRQMASKPKQGWNITLDYARVLYTLHQIT